MKDRLIELLESTPADFDGRRNVVTIAEYLLANGVIVPPCNVGDTVYYIAGKKIYKAKCHAITLQPSLQIHLYDYDGDNARYSTKDVFRSRKEAEQALKERC